MDTSSKKKFKYTTEVIILAGYLLFFCLAFILFYFFLMSIFLKRPMPPINTFATSLPPTTPIPHISLTAQMEGIKIFEDDFSSDKNHWAFDTDVFKEEVSGGTLIFESKFEDNYAFTGCGACPYLKEPYYIQADFTASETTDEGFGIVFGLKSGNQSFYLFKINTEAKKYFVYHRASGKWSLRAAGESDQIESFPTKNTLGVYANSDTAEFYINGNIVESYTDSKNSFHIGYFSFYVDGSGFKLIVDNLVLTK